MHELIIRNARIIDGTGGATFEGAVAVDGAHISAVLRAGDAGTTASARHEIDAEGHLLTPGFVDIHTHYDGQLCWDKQLTPSCWHGMTTVVMGNCGVGFAPVHRGREHELIEVMASVEDIPGAVLREGMSSGWESFGEYLDAIDTPYVMDVGTQVPHVAPRYYVMGERSCEDIATADEMAAMAGITRQALRIERQHSVLGLSDGGAHCATLCDAGMSTYVFAYMSRDRSKGLRLPLEFAVHKLTQDTARAYGLHDRGGIAPGYRADLNIIDFQALALCEPEMVRDLPGGGRRLLQKARGYRATLCAGELTYEHGQHTGAMPGRLVRGGQR